MKAASCTRRWRRSAGRAQSSMGLAISKALEGLLGKKEMRILMVGLDASGKTSILYRLKLGKPKKTIPTIGFNVETLEYKNIAFTVWDVGGQEKLRALWRHYFANTQARGAIRRNSAQFSAILRNSSEPVSVTAGAHLRRRLVRPRAAAGGGRGAPPPDPRGGAQGRAPPRLRQQAGPPRRVQRRRDFGADAAVPAAHLEVVLHPELLRDDGRRPLRGPRLALVDGRPVSAARGVRSARACQVGVEPKCQRGSGLVAVKLYWFQPN